MFHMGDLQSGIATALRDSKMVACFVKDEGEESKTWEEEWLQTEEVAEMLSTKTVLLKLQDGSQDAAYLAAICPIPRTPVLVIIHNGQLKEYLISGTTHAAFVSRLTAVLKEQASLERTIAEPAQKAEGSGESGFSQSSTAQQSSSKDQSSAHTVTSTVSNGQASQSIQDVPAEHRVPTEPKPPVHLASQQDNQERAKTIPRESDDSDHIALLKKRQEDAREERSRILKRVEDDKAERRNREAERKAEKVAAGREGPKFTEVPSSIASPRPSNQCAIQVRLFDGTTIRSRFPSSNTLRTEVRRWIDEQRGGDDIPYSFRQVLTPHPNRIISIHEEEETLQSIGLTPSATLILVPVKEYASAYGTSEQGLIAKGATAGYSLLSSGIGLVTGAFSSLLTRNEASIASASQPEQNYVPGETVPSSNVRVRTLHDQHDTQEDYQLYNGNTLNFEPRRDKEDDKTD